MVDGININTSQLSATSGAAASKPVVKEGEARQRVPQAKTNGAPEGRQGTAGALSVIAKSSEKRFAALSSANGGDFLKAAEKLIDASLPNKPPGTRLRINRDEGSGRFVYQGVDINTGDVITQFPSEEILKFVAFNRERDGLEGIVVDEEA
jgi:flagellar protein FlaG